MSTDNHKAHSEYLKEKGKFIINCRQDIFKPQEIEVLEKYGHWFEALTNGTLLPFNAVQAQFIEVAQSRREPETDYEWTWSKYIKRRKIEAEKGDVLHKSPAPVDDTFYSRDMAKKLKGIMFKETRENHKK
ncbi:MAG TPA: DUF413 domain-containing protein [Puia sp.]|nr:DUF413 domain-containing protein [Puia sp.]